MTDFQYIFMVFATISPDILHKQAIFYRKNRLYIYRGNNRKYDNREERQQGSGRIVHGKF